MQLKWIRFALWIFVFVWMAVIFGLSSQVASTSSTLSGSTVRIVVEHTQPGFGKLPAAQQNNIVEQYQHLIRKTAHVLLYMFLGMLCMAAFSSYAMSLPRKSAAALAVCIGYAGTDEIHQLFVAGRSGQISDVGIDSCGAMLGIGAVIVIIWAWHKLQRKTNRTV